MAVVRFILHPRIQKSACKQHNYNMLGALYNALDFLAELKLHPVQSANKEWKL